jgi:hypothetical protein
VRGSPPGLRVVLEGQASGLLEALVAHWSAAGVSLPARRVIAPGAPGLIAWDCEQVVLSLGQILLGTAEDSVSASAQLGAAASNVTRAAQWSIQVVRCTPEQDDAGEPPAVEVLTEAGLAALVDAGLLSQFVTNLATWPPDWIPPGGRVRGGGVTSLGPQGGYHGFEATLTLPALEVQGA